VAPRFALHDASDGEFERLAIEVMQRDPNNSR
jgi:hypothetical protein